MISLGEVVPGLVPGDAVLKADYPPRPGAFSIGKLRRLQVREGCDQRRSALFRFRDSGRLLYAWTVFGPRPSRALRARAEAILDSLRIAPPR